MDRLNKTRSLFYIKVQGGHPKPAIVKGLNQKNTPPTVRLELAILRMQIQAFTN